MSIFTIARVLVPIVGLTASFLAAGMLLRRGFPFAWNRWLRRACVVAVQTAVGAFLVWHASRFLVPDSIIPAILQVVMMMVVVSAVVLALTGVVWGPVAIITAPKPSSLFSAGPGPDGGRRAFLRGVTGAVPVAAAMTGPAGTIAASVKPVLTRLTVRSRNVDAGLAGFTILQLTDVHLGTFIHEDQFQAVVDAVQEAGVHPDVVVLTGDIADDFTQLPGALKRLEALQATHGVVAIIGNHEIYRGRAAAERIYQEAGVRFLSGNGVLLEHGRDGQTGQTGQTGRLWLAGADDPARGLDGPAPFLRRTVDDAFQACPDDVSCRVLLTHRPRGFEHALPHGVTLALAGHTHGGQVALFGRSLFEAIWPESFMLGRYTRDGARGPATLYTSAGLGHWMPFRLNCPCEAVLVRLEPVDDVAVA